MTLDLDVVRARIHERSIPALARLVREASTDEIVELLDALPTAEGVIVFRLLDKQVAAVVLDDLSTLAQADLVALLGHADVAEAFAGLDPDEQASLLDELPASVARRLVDSVDVERLEPVMTLLGYPQASIGRRMEPTTVRLTTEQRVDEALDAIRAHPEAAAWVPVLTPHRVLVGMVDAASLLRHDPATELVDVLVHARLVAHTHDDAEHVARLALDRGALVVPVLDAEDRLVGVLPIEDAARIDRDAVAEDHARTGASERLRRPYLVTPVRTVTRARVVWLLVLAVSAVLTVQVLELFEATLQERVVLALFIPLLTGIGGNTGSQAATTVTRALAVGEVRVRDVARVAWKEMRTGLLLGSVLAVLALGIATPIYGFEIGLVLALTLIANCPVAATVGGVVPLVARACKVDPAVFSTPFISTFCDASGLLVYCAIAVAVLGL